MLKRKIILVAGMVLVLASTLAHADYIYVSSYGDGTIKKFDSNGAGGSTFVSGLTQPFGIAFASGNLYAVNNGGNGGSNGGDTITKYDSGGTGSTFATGFYSTHGLARGGLAFDSGGNLYASSHTGKIVKFDSGGSASDFATGLSYPYGLAFGSGGGQKGLAAFNGSGYLYAAIRTDGNVTNFDSGGAGYFFTSDPNHPQGLAFDGSGNLYVANYDDGTIEKFDSGGNGSTFATGLSYPRNIAFDSSGNLYVADSGSGTIVKIDSGGNGSTFATGLNSPYGIAVQFTVPEPATIGLLSLGALAFFRKRKR